jgi:hypothetical protein
VSFGIALAGARSHSPTAAAQPPIFGSFFFFHVNAPRI